MKEHIVILTDEDRCRLRDLACRGTHAARVIRRAQILLKSDAGLTDKQIAEHVGCTDRCVADVRKRFCTGGLPRAVYDAPRCGVEAKFTPRQQQQIVALACSAPPEGRVRWTIELLREEAVRQGIVESISVGKVHLILKEHDLKPWRKKNLVYPATDPGVSREDGRRVAALRKAPQLAPAGGLFGRKAETIAR